MKKIGILGSRGIPNEYGGFEQFAEHLSLGLHSEGYDVWVYGSHYHPYMGKLWNGIHIIHIRDPKSLGLASQFIYDLLCILHARRQGFDVIIQLGYTTSSVWAWLLPPKARIIYNMDGMEWKRKKYSGLIKMFLRYAERLAIRASDAVIADSLPIQDYLGSKYKRDIQYIPYPAVIFNNPDPAYLQAFNLTPSGYYLLIARFQPDNNIETIIRGVVDSKSALPLIVVGDYSNRYGRYLKRRYSDQRIVFAGRIFDRAILDNLRYHSFLYFHGHSAGGTNPSLLEAMAAQCSICAHDNEFNRSVLDHDALYFSTAADITAILDDKQGIETNPVWVENNLSKLRTNYRLDGILYKYTELIK